MNYQNKIVFQKKKDKNKDYDLGLELSIGESSFPSAPGRGMLLKDQFIRTYEILSKVNDNLCCIQNEEF